MNQPVQKRSGGDHDGPRSNPSPIHDLDPAHLPTAQNETDNFRLSQEQTGLPLQNSSHLYAVFRLIRLTAGGLNRRAAAAVEQTKLDAGSIGHFAHDAAEGVYLTHQMTFCDPPNCRVARHLGNEIKIHRDESGLCPHACSGHRGFATRVPASYDYHVESFLKFAHPLTP